MIVIPAVDLRGGRCVRLLRGEASAETVYGDPVAMAERWAREGAARIHVVDLDGAFAGTPKQMEVVRRIAQEVEVPLQVGGGLRTAEAVAEALEAGAVRAVVGTAAARDPSFIEELIRRFGVERIIAAVDARDGRVAVEGWTREAETGAGMAELAGELAARGVREILCTEISRDGTLSGPDLDGLRQVARCGAGIIASGGVSSLEDLAALAALEPNGVFAAVVGKALYEGRFSLEEAMAAAEDTAPGRPGV
ncbi:MAG: 1-(5-phosphoribosyl)-5-[(5-phosphoribosylamino)methylideneamino]imidazole-4-carboxamide isomerase [Firmicutes bacterium]|nr:1-(5-phosphoribosyl)-5-[(5-phosphoribosylamino)methylideneamino]imidazole-4-carboxamide isomerase [Bacillota bacterium]